MKSGIDPENITQKNIIQEIKRMLDNVKGESETEYKRVKQIQVTGRFLLKHEERRLHRKYGELHPRYERVVARLQHNLNAVRYFNTLSTIMPAEPGAEPAPPDEDVWIIEGQVRDESGQGLDRMIVSPYDKDLIFDDQLGITVTGPDGRFRIAYRAKKFRDLIEAKPDIYIKVFDEEGKTRYSSRKKVKYNAGRVETFDIKIRGPAEEK